MCREKVIISALNEMQTVIFVQARFPRTRIAAGLPTKRKIAVAVAAAKSICFSNISKVEGVEAIHSSYKEPLHENRNPYLRFRRLSRTKTTLAPARYTFKLSKTSNIIKEFFRHEKRIKFDILQCSIFLL